MAENVRTRRNSREDADSPMDQDPNDAAIEGAVDIAIVHGPGETPPLNICDMNDDCCKETFSYLRLKELVSMGRTCKRMNQIVLDILKQSYPVLSAKVRNGTIQKDGINLHGFSKSIQSISIFRSNQKDFDYIVSNPFDSLKHIRFALTNLSLMNIGRMRKILKQIETLQFESCTLTGDLYEGILKHCVNLKRLDVEPNYWSQSSVTIGNGNEWLKQKYPNLENFPLHKRMYSYRTFFAQNPQIRKITIDNVTLQQNLVSIMETELKLETLEIVSSYSLSDNTRKTVQVLNELHTKGLYRRLEISRLHWRFDLQQYTSLCALDKIQINLTHSSSYEELAAFTNLKELAFVGLLRHRLEMVAKKLTNLERVDFDNANDGHLLDFIHYSANLKVIRVDHLSIDLSPEGLINHGALLELPKWNRQRAKLNGARKLTIFVHENVYLNTKWALKQTDLSLIEIKRIHADKGRIW